MSMISLHLADPDPKSINFAAFEGSSVLVSQKISGKHKNPVYTYSCNTGTQRPTSKVLKRDQSAEALHMGSGSLSYPA